MNDRQSKGMVMLRWGWLALVLVVMGDVTASAESLSLNLRKRAEVAPNTGRFQATVSRAQWDAQKTAIVVCDMWDQHWCPNATARVAEMAPRMNEVLKAARAKGVLIIHCPSDTLDFYKDHPGRKLAQQAPPAPTQRPLERWCKLVPEKEGPLPIDDSDGGCDCAEPVQSRKAWSRQIAALEIHDGDAITDSAEAYYLMKQRGVENVIVMGVHTNMCVLGRPFSIRQLVYQGLNVALMRDLTDTMYNPAKAPFVSHFTGTDLVVEHIEKHWCPTLISGDLLDGKEFRFAADRRPHLLIVSAEDEYKTEQTLPTFAAAQLAKDFRISYAFETPGAKHSISGLEALDDADVLLLSVRRRPLPKEQLDRFRKFIAAGKPVVGIRTASHPFHLRNQPPPEGLADWPEFDAQVNGGHYTNHHGNDLKAWIWPRKDVKHPILEGIPDGETPMGGSLYMVQPLAATTTVLLEGRAEGVAQHEPVAWVNRRADGGKTFYTSLGHPDNFASPVFQRLLKNAVYWAAEGVGPKPRAQAAAAVPAAAVALNAANAQPRGWTSLPVPGTWDSHRPELQSYDGFAWYRSTVNVPGDWKNRALYLYVEKVDNACETFFNGVKIGVSGTLPPAYTSGLATNEHRYVVPAGIVKFGEPNVVAIRVYDHDGAGGFKGRAPALLGGNEAISLEGEWQFRTGDDLAWAKESPENFAAFAKIGPPPQLTPFATVINRTAQDQPLSPAASRGLFKVPDDLEVELVLSEPQVAQPLFLNFDERGRLWVLQYLQYPEPAGLTLVSKDQWWRAVYDKIPDPPPKGVKGADKITIHEDTDGDGQFDRHQTFVDGLNIATSFAQGRGGVYVLNPPYLLFYPDRNHDDVPDGDPEVLLSGFGLEDTHSVCNSLRWGPDGWLYGAQGSTVSATVKRPGDKTGVHSQGQNIWRYHPETKRYEIFAEGGGNAFSCEIDSAGRVFSGHNGGNTRGFHYMQGAYLQKGFSKHGPLSNPYTFGYFPAMEHGNYARFTHNFIVYEGDGLPAQYFGKIFGVNPITHHVVISERIPVGSTFKTKDVGFAIDSDDAWFRPVDIKDGPDGNLYVADWYDGQLAHTANYQGGMDRERGRVWRIRSKQPRKVSPATVALRPNAPERLAANVDLSQLSSSDLVTLLASAQNRWHRQMALRLLADRRSPDTFLTVMKAKPPAFTVDLLWARYLTGGWQANGGMAQNYLALSDAATPAAAAIRLWTVQLLGDENRLPAALAPAIADLARTEPNAEVLCQLASTAKRVPAEQGLPIVRNLLTRSEFVDDPRVPLMAWWALEGHVQPAREAVLALFADAALWREPLVEKEILPRLMRRFAATGQRSDLAVCAQLLKQSPSKEATAALMRGFEEAFQGRSLSNVPPELVAALSQAGGGSLSLKVRQGDQQAVAEALKFLADEKAPSAKRSEYAALFGEVKAPGAVDVLLAVLGQTSDDGLKSTILAALPAYNDDRIAPLVLQQYGQLTDDVRTVAQSLLVSRKAWALQLAEAVDRGDIAAKSLPVETVRKLTIHRDERLAALIQKHWGEVEGASTAEMQAQLEHFTAVLADGGGNPYPGKKLYLQACGKCHTLHAQGGQIGPDLTTYKRDDIRALLQNIINPSAEIREGFETLVAVTTEGRVVTGFLVEQDAQIVVLRGSDGQTVSLARSEIEELARARKSLMPEGQLKELTDEQVRDLFAYLRSAQPLAD